MRGWGARDLYNSTRAVRVFEFEPAVARHGLVIPPPAGSTLQRLNPEACGTTVDGGSNSPLYSEVGDDLGGHDGELSSILGVRETEDGVVPTITSNAPCFGRASTPQRSPSDEGMGVRHEPLYHNVPAVLGNIPLPQGSESFASVASAGPGGGGSVHFTSSSDSRESSHHENPAGKRSVHGSPTGKDSCKVIIYFLKQTIFFQLPMLAGRSTSGVFHFLLV